MLPENLNLNLDLPALVAQDTRLTRCGQGYSGPCPFCGGRDRFTLKPTPAGWRWFCRKCGQGKYHSAIDYLMQREALDFKTVIARLGGKLSQPAALPLPARPLPARRALPDSDWQRAAWQEVQAACDCLLGEAQAAPVRDYLARRGLERGVWLAHNLGAAQVYDPRLKRKRLALSLPWWDTDGSQEMLSAVKYRFIEQAAGGLRYLSRAGSLFLLYGLAYALESDTRLLLVEGEINALSIWQCQPQGVSVVSVGSEGGGRPEILRALAQRYQRVLVWLDKPEKARALAAALGCPHPTLLQSPRLDGEKWDANRMLQAGELQGFLKAVL